MRFLILLVGALELSTATVDFEEWEQFKQTHRKSYGRTEDEARKKMYAINKERVEKHNVMYSQNLVTYSMKLNQFSDLSSEEWTNLIGLKIEPLDRKVKTTRQISSNDNIKEWDWRKHGAVTEVKNQYDTNTSWAFSSTGLFEGIYYLKKSKLVSMSEQNIIDCSRHGDSNKGFSNSALALVYRQKGLATEDSYPYENVTTSCRYKDKNKTIVDIQIKREVLLIEPYEDDLLPVVYGWGPVAVTINAIDNLRFYKDGIFYDLECNSKDLNHSVLVVGFGSTEEHDYWTIKNSWGPNWGQNGYFLLARNKDNHCGVASAPVMAIMENTATSMWAGSVLALVATLFVVLR